MARWSAAHSWRPRASSSRRFESHVTYTLQSTLTSGSIECLIENLSSDTNGGKTKVFSSQQGYSDITDNPYRFTIEKRGDDHPDSGKYRLRIITGNATSGFYDSDRIQPSSLVASKVYYHRVSWANNVVNFVVREGSATGPQVASYAFSYQGTYRPSPHVVHIGAPVPRGGAVDASVPGIIVRYFYVSQGGTYPGFALAVRAGPERTGAVAARTFSAPDPKGPGQSSR